MGFVTQTRAGLMTRDPRKEDVVKIPRVGRTNDRHKGGLILHVLTERPPDVLKRPKILIYKKKTSIYLYYIVQSILYMLS